jgi:hypothetical protein
MGGSSPKPPPPPPPAEDPAVDEAELARRNARKQKQRVTTNDLRIEPGIRTPTQSSGLSL